MHTHTHACAHTHTHTYAHTHTHTHADTHAHTHARTQVSAALQPSESGMSALWSAIKKLSNGDVL